MITLVDAVILIGMAILFYYIISYIYLQEYRNKPSRYKRYRIKRITRYNGTRYKLYTKYVYQPLYISNYGSFGSLQSAITKMKELQNADINSKDNSSKWLSDDDLRMEQL